MVEVLTPPLQRVRCAASTPRANGERRPTLRPLPFPLADQPRYFLVRESGLQLLPCSEVLIHNDLALSAPTLEQRLDLARGLLATDPAAALEQANSILSERADARAFRLTAAALRALGRAEEAAQAELKGINEGFTQSLRQARAANQSGRSSQAKSIAEEYLQSNGDDLLAMTIAAEAALGLDRPDEAESTLRQVVNRAPDFPPANLLLASALASQLRLHEAADVLQAFLKRVPRATSAKRFLADILAQMNDPFSAATVYEEISVSGSNSPADQLKYAQLLRIMGRKTEPVGVLRGLTASSPIAGNAWWMLAHYFPDQVTDKDEQRIRAAIAAGGGQGPDRGFLQLAVSILDQRRGNYEAAFKAIISAQALMPSGFAYDPNFLSCHVDELIAAYSPQTFERFASYGSKSDTPIFIVGMPRSGSTMLERILGQHSKVEPTGELPLVPRIVAMEADRGTAAYKSLLPHALTGEKITEIAEWYLTRSQEYRLTSKHHFTDKYNGNWIRAGLIRIMFPNARIVDIRRDPLDSCWAVFKSVLVGDYANNQQHVARYYADYVRLMDAMAATSPDSVFTLSYESLVADIKGQTERVLDFLGLEFEPACLDFHRSSAAVTTASSEQVRRPINSDSIGAAEPYRRWLQPMIAELETRLISETNRP